MKKAVFLTVFIFICLFTACCFISDKKNNNQTAVKFASWGSKSEISIIRGVIADFEKNNPDIKVNLIHIPQNYFQKIQLLFASGLEPDVVFFNNQNIQMYIHAGLLEDLTPYFPDLEKRFYSEALSCFKKDNRLYAVPRDISNLVIYYNKDILKKSGIKIPKKIKDIYELKKLAAKLTNQEHFGINSEDNPMYWLYYAASNGGGILSDDGKRLLINSPKTIEALDLYAQMINIDHSMPSKAQIGSMTQAQMFINGKLAMYLSGRWMTPKIRETAGFDWDVIEFPAKEKVYIDSSGWALSKNSKHKKEAAALIKYLSDTKTLSRFAASGLIVPADRTAVLQDKSQKPENYSAFTEMLKNAAPSPVNENYAVILDIIKEKTDSIFNGKKSAAEAFDKKTEAKLESLL